MMNELIKIGAVYIAVSIAVALLFISVAVILINRWIIKCRRQKDFEGMRVGYDVLPAVLVVDIIVIVICILCSVFIGICR